MTHSFDTEIAKKYGIEEAILYQNITFWCDKNRANNVNIHDGYAWTYNTYDAFQELFPYMKINTIKSALKNLKDGGLIMVRNDINKDKWDKTNHYASTVNKVTIDSEEKQLSIINKNNHLIIDTDINTDINTDAKKSVCDDFISDLKTKVKYKSKVTKTKELDSLLKSLLKKHTIESIKQAYIKHQLDKDNYAVRITKFLEDYETVYSVTTIKQDDYVAHPTFNQSDIEKMMRGM